MPIFTREIKKMKNFTFSQHFSLVLRCVLALVILTVAIIYSTVERPAYASPVCQIQIGDKGDGSKFVKAIGDCSALPENDRMYQECSLQFRKKNSTQDWDAYSGKVMTYKPSLEYRAFCLRKYRGSSERKR
jgi:hypothetical protein